MLSIAVSSSFHILNNELRSSQSRPILACGTLAANETDDAAKTSLAEIQKQHKTDMACGCFPIAGHLVSLCAKSSCSHSWRRWNSSHKLAGSLGRGAGVTTRIDSLDVPTRSQSKNARRGSFGGESILGWYREAGPKCRGTVYHVTNLTACHSIARRSSGWAARDTAY
jgi:hypothetical protein